MCRSKDEGGPGRRCKCDSSVARLNRRSNAEMKDKYVSDVLHKTTAHPSNILGTASSITPETVREDIDHLNSLLHNPDSSLEDIDNALLQVGEGVNQLAERKHGAPSDDDFAQMLADAGYSDYMQAQEEVVKGDEEFDSLYEKYRAEVGLENPIAKVAKFARTEELVEHGLSQEKAEELRSIKRETEDAERRVASALTSPTSAEESKHTRTNLMLKRNEGIRKALEDVGVTLASPESLDYAQASQPAAIKAVKSALPFFPQTWVESSNAVTQRGNVGLILKVSGRRAHYAANKKQQNRTMGKLTSVSRFSNGRIPDPSTKEGQEYQPALLQEDGTFINPVTQKPIAPYETSGYADGEIWVRQHYTYQPQKSQAPKGRGWEQVAYEHKEWDSDKQEWSSSTVHAWRKPVITKLSGTTTRADEVTINLDKVATSDVLGHRVALHEMSHRFEDTIPVISRAEKAFLDRRIGAGTASEESPTLISKFKTGSPAEIGYRDRFADHYMGRVYPGGKYYELLSVGMESVFAGSHNGLTHTASTLQPPDPDYRKFILGMLTIKPS